MDRSGNGRDVWDLTEYEHYELNRRQEMRQNLYVNHELLESMMKSEVRKEA
jgi:hypothetical protein